MKTKLRKIIINQAEYVYRVSDKYYPGNGLSTLTVKVYLSGKKQTPLTIRFLTLEHYYAGQPLKTGVILLHSHTNSEVSVNLNEPKFIRELIELGTEKGWKGSNQLEVKDGLNWLNELGYNVSELEAEVEKVLQIKTNE